MDSDWKLPETHMIAELVIYGFEPDEAKEALETVKSQIETGLDMQGISGTDLVCIMLKNKEEMK